MDVVERAYDTNVFADIRMCKAVIPYMAARKSGTIVIFNAVSGCMYATCLSSSAYPLPTSRRETIGTYVNIHSPPPPLPDVASPTPWAGIYSSTKSAAQSLTDVLDMECKPLNISVLSVITGGRPLDHRREPSCS